MHIFARQMQQQNNIDKNSVYNGQTTSYNHTTEVESSTLRTENLVKKYGKRTVVNHVSINVSQGEIVGLLGPNGAGKTTTFYMSD